MNQFLFFTSFSPLIDLFVITSLLLAREAIGMDNQFLACNPKTCGDAQIITFPFYIQDEQESFCGYPGFNVSCQNGHPIIRLQDNDYIIRSMSYETQTLRLTNFAVYDTRTTCTPPFRNASIPSDRFNIYPNQTELFLLYHCNSSQIDGNSELIKYKVNCSSDNASNSTLLISKDDPLLDNASSICENMIATVVDVQRGGERINEIERMLERGFVLNWVSSNCSLCQGSGGTCGFDNNTYHFRCFCRDRRHASHCNSDNSGSMVIIIAPIATAAGIGILIITVCYLRRRNIIFCWKKKTQDCKSIEAFLRSHGPFALKRYRYSEVKKMTGTFKIKLGQGGYGSVFKGELPDGCLVAVKVLKESKSNGEEFINEVASISRTSLINIVTLLGFCFEGSKRALVYEFIANGSLEKYICEENALNSNHLGWETLFDIAVGIARGLEYLHRGCNTRILHFDIKPHNILLDENFCPKISDFGLAKVCTKRESIISMKDARGTIGYIAPEVFLRNTGGVSHKSDVYSYGMLVLEMVGGRKNISVEADNTSEVYFPDWIYRCLEVGKELGLGRINNEEEKQIARKMVLVSLWCIQTDPSNRPPMSRVVEMLRGSVSSLPIAPKPNPFSPFRPLLQSMADFSTTTIVTS